MGYPENPLDNGQRRSSNRANHQGAPKSLSKKVSALRECLPDNVNLDGELSHRTDALVWPAIDRVVIFKNLPLPLARRSVAGVRVVSVNRCAGIVRHASPWWDP